MCSGMCNEWNNLLGLVRYAHRPTGRELFESSTLRNESPYSHTHTGIRSEGNGNQMISNMDQEKKKNGFIYAWI